MVDQKASPADTIDASLEAGDLEQARADLQDAPSEDEFTVLRIKLALYESSIPPELAMQRLIQMMRRAPDVPRAKQLYQEASNMAYQSRQSSHSHSHPPPAAKTDEPKNVG